MGKGLKFSLRAFKKPLLTEEEYQLLSYLQREGDVSCHLKCLKEEAKSREPHLADSLQKQIQREFIRSMFMYFGKKDDREFMAIEMYLRDKSNDVAKEYIYSHSRHIIQNFVTNNRTEEVFMNFIKLGLMTAEACEYILDVAIKKEYTEISAYALNMLGKYPAEKQKFAL